MLANGVRAGGAAGRSPWRPTLGVCVLVLILGICVGGVTLAGLASLAAAEQRAMELARGRIDRGLTAIQRVLAERQARLGDQAQLLAQQPRLLEAFAARDQQALSEILAAARTQFGSTSAAAVVDEKGRSIADHPPRQPYDYRKLAIMRAALSPGQPVVIRPRVGVEARPATTAPLADLGLAGAYPLLVDGQPAGAVVLLQAFNDAFLQTLADATGLDVAVLTPESLLAGSRELRALFPATEARPHGQRLTPVTPNHSIAGVGYVAAGSAIRSWTTIPGIAAAPAGRGAPTVATLFVGLKRDHVIGGLERLRVLLAGLVAAAAVAAVAGAVLLERLLWRPVERAVAGLMALVEGRPASPVKAGILRETAALAGAFNAANAATSCRLQALSGEVRKLEAVIDSVTEGIIVLDERSGLVTLNGAAERLLGLPGGLPAGIDLAAVLTPGQWEALRPALLRRDRLPSEVSLPEPRQAILRVTVVPVHDDFARSVGWAIVLQDVTEERLLDNVKADFFTAMSHELRTPLTAIKGAAEVLLDGDLPPTQARFLQKIYQNADRLSRLVTDLLDISKLESGRFDLRLVRVDLNEVVADVVAALEPVAKRENQRLIVRTKGPSLPLVADHDRLEQIVTNLVSNACQYTQEDGDIVVSTWREGDEACLTIADNGAGISSVDQLHLFDKFYQGVNALTRRRGGSGLGLTIVKHLTELHGGHISVQSRPGVGSTFAVRLPLTPAKPTDGPDGTEVVPHSASLALHSASLTAPLQARAAGGAQRKRTQAT
ncbi:MAG: PAS domain-containing protein [Chloroflexi bacterium]|nr:PAS domain-containing protein [Chloroflexota bacterium]